METLAALGHGFAVALTPMNLFWSALGVTVGTAIGVLPGIGPALTVALLLPVTANLDPTAAFIMFGGIYYGAMYGGSTTSILLNTPGESGSIVTAIDGNMMARKGRGAQALATAAIGSFVAGTIATLALSFVAPQLVKLALLFGPAEYFALMVLALTTVTAVLGDSLARGLASLFIGLALGLVGIDLQTGQARFTMGVLELLDGIDTVVVAVGLFAIGETLYAAARLQVREGGDLRARRLDVDERARTGRGPGSPGCAARSWASRSAPCRPAAARSRPSSPTWSRSGWPRTPRSSARVRSRPWPAPRPPTTPPSPARWPPSCRWACRPRPRPPSCSPPSSNTACSPGRCCSTATPTWSGA